MLFLKHLLTIFQISIGIVPLWISVIAARLWCWPLALVAVAGVFIVVAIFPLFRRRESLWVFFFVLLTVTPINLAIIDELLHSFLFEDSFLLTNIIRGSLIFTIALSIEELACGLVARMIWKKQYKTVMMQE